MYRDHIPALKAEEALAASTVAAVPYMSESDQRELADTWRIQADLVVEEPFDRISFEEFKRTDMKQRIG